MNLVKFAFVALLACASVSTFVGCESGSTTPAPASTEGSTEGATTEGGSTEGAAEGTTTETPAE